MAEALSLAASIIAVLGAAECVAKGISKVYSIHCAPDEILSLNNEISDLKVLIYDVQRYITNTPKSHLPQNHVQQLRIPIDRAKEKLLQLDGLIQHRILKPQPLTGKLKISKIEWLKAVKVIGRSRQSLRDIRCSIDSRFLLINSSVSLWETRFRDRADFC